MKFKILLYGLVAAMVTGCSSAYKASQTPDDVYYSPARPAGVAAKEKHQDRYEDYVSSQDDQYLRMKIRDRQRWSTIDDYSYWNDSRYIPSYSYSYYRNNWHSPYAWNTWNSPYYNSYYSPFYSGGLNFYGNYYPHYGYYGYTPYTNVYISKYPTRTSSGVSRPSLNGYNNRNYNNGNNTYITPGRQGLGNSFKRVITPSENRSYNNNNRNNTSYENSNNTYRAPERTYTPSSSGSSGSSSSGGSSGGGVSRPSRN